MRSGAPASVLRFGECELDLAAFALRRRGRVVRIERRPLELLILLVGRRGELVTRADIAGRLWDPDVFVDQDIALNTAIKKVRRALGDPAEAPRFIETVTGKGYRFIAHVEEVVSSRRPLVLAVLPFVNLGGRAEHDYIADGFTDEAIAALGQIEPSRLRVIGRTSAMRYKGATTSLRVVGEELGASYILEGAIRADGDRWRVTTALVQLPEQTQLWSAAYDSEVMHMLEFQRALCTAVAEQVRVRIDASRLASLDRRRSLDADAFDLYLRGRHFWNQLTPETSRRAIECYTRATVLDPTFGLAWSGTADAYAAAPITGDVPSMAVWSKARDAARRASKTAPDLAESHTSIGSVHYWLEWDWPQAEAAYRRAIALDAGYALAPRMLGVVLSHMGRHDEAALFLRRARELDPLYAMHHALSAQAALLARRYDDGLQFARQAIVIDSRFWVGHFQLAQVQVQLGDFAAALDALAAAERFNNNTKMLALRGYIHGRDGRPDEARQVCAALSAIAQERYVPPYATALVALGLGDTAMVFEWLEQALAARDVHLVFLPVDPKWDPLRTDARFLDLLGRCGFARD